MTYVYHGRMEFQTVPSFQHNTMGIGAHFILNYLIQRLYILFLHDNIINCIAAVIILKLFNYCCIVFCYVFFLIDFSTYVGSSLHFFIRTVTLFNKITYFAY